MAMSSAPHRNLYTRLRAGPTGVGVFAIRDIPAGTVLFVGDTGATTRVPVEDVERIEDGEIRQMYFDFCPVVDGAFVAPRDFNQLTMGWYLNHSDDPNVLCEQGLRFVVRRLVAKGEELKVDYATFSESAAAAVESWSQSRVGPRPIDEP
jgi:uncharacterized protein